MSIIAEIALNVEKGKKNMVLGLVREAAVSGLDPNVILNQGMVSAMENVGEAFKNGTIYVPEMLVAARAMKAGIDVLKPFMTTESRTYKGKVLLGTVAGDLHDIGKNLVGMMLETAGFEVVDLGVDVGEFRFIEAYKENPDTKIIALSALLTNTMPAMESTVRKLNAAPFRRKIKIMVGGAPITQQYADRIGADAYTADAAAAAEKAKELVK